MRTSLRLNLLFQRARYQFEFGRQPAVTLLQIIRRKVGLQSTRQRRLELLDAGRRARICMRARATRFRARELNEFSVKGGSGNRVLPRIAGTGPLHISIVFSRLQRFGVFLGFDLHQTARTLFQYKLFFFSRNSNQDSATAANIHTVAKDESRPNEMPDLRSSRSNIACSDRSDLHDLPVVSGFLGYPSLQFD